MWIEFSFYNEKSLINSDNIRAIYVKSTGLYICFDYNQDIHYAFETNLAAQACLSAFKLALTGCKATIEGIGYVTPLIQPNERVDAYLKIEEIKKACTPDYKRAPIN